MHLLLVVMLSTSVTLSTVSMGLASKQAIQELFTHVMLIPGW